MYFRVFFITVVLTALLVPVCTFGIGTVRAQMQSSSYRIESDSINFGGGFSTSSNYTLESTAGEVGTGDLGSTNFNLRAGYQQIGGGDISLSVPENVSMSPSIAGVSGGTANGSTSVLVITNNSAGYSLTIAANQSPALVSGGNTIADYVPAGNPDFVFSTASNEAHFGYSPSGVDVAARFLDDGASCNVGSLETELACWDGLRVTDEVVAYRTSANAPDGSTTTINFRTEVGGSVNQPEGLYMATTTLTALPL